MTALQNQIPLIRCKRCGSTDLGEPLNRGYLDVTKGQVYKCYRCGFEGSSRYMEPYAKTEKKSTFYAVNGT